MFVITPPRKAVSMREGWRLSPHVAVGLKEEPKIRESIHTKPYIPLNVCCSESGPGQVHAPDSALSGRRPPPPLQESACCVRVELLSRRQTGGCDRRSQIRGRSPGCVRGSLGPTGFLICGPPGAGGCCFPPRYCSGLGRERRGR